MREAREEKNMTINDLAYALVKNKDDKELMKKWEKKITSWEEEKAYPTLEEIYQMAYIINLNPGELLEIRNRGRKQFYKESNDPPIKKHDWIEISDNASIIFSCISKSFGVIALIIFCVVLYKFVDTFFGKTGSIVEQEVIIRQIQNETDPENMVDDGSVANMVRRVRNEGVTDMGF